MTKEIKLDNWIAALRSGTYNQGRERLRLYEDSYCCLGVLCDIYDPKGWEQKYNGYFWYDSSSLLPSNLESFVSSRTQDILTTLNDRGASFSDIARILSDFYSWEELNENIRKDTFVNEDKTLSCLVSNRNRGIYLQNTTLRTGRFVG